MYKKNPTFRKIGAPQQKSIEPFIDGDVLSELEDWSAVITRDPMVLRELEKIDQGTESDDQNHPTPKNNLILRGPRP